MHLVRKNVLPGWYIQMGTELLALEKVVVEIAVLRADAFR